MKKKFVLLGIDHPHYGAMIQAVNARDDIEFAAVAQETSPFADEVAKKWGVKCYSRYLDALDAEKPDVVGIAMYNGARGNFICEAISRKIPVITDKPLCVTITDYNRIKNALDKSNTPLCMMLSCRCNPSYVAMKNAVSEGLVGEVLSVDAVRYYALNRPKRPDWMFNRKSYGGPGIDILAHDYDLARWITGIDWPDIVLTEYRSGFIADRDFSDGANISSCDNNRSLALKMLWNSPKKHWDRFAILGTKGFLEMSFCDKRVAHVNENGDVNYLRSLPLTKPFAAQFFDALIDGSMNFPVSREDSLLITERLVKAIGRT
ncbi:MAG: Gfo/Idh/MocA family oxidoreductase [Kiritimatiellae bacterium]|nr:Gfo/Idh/MocA family oxidoreductase [Kiritimatiellia bacterium]